MKANDINLSIKKCLDYRDPNPQHHARNSSKKANF